MRTTKYIILIIIAILIYHSSTFGQNNMKIEVINFMEEYEKYASFTKDGLSYEASYEKPFQQLFVRNNLSNKAKSYQVFNDIDTLVERPYIKASGYVKKISKNFPKGINVIINVIKIDKLKENRLAVQVIKKVFGLTNSKEIYKKDFALVFIIKYKEDENGQIRQLKILKITAEGYPREPMGLYIGLNIQPAISSIATKDFLNSDNTYGNWTEKGKMTFSGGLEMNYYFEKYPFLGIGARINYTTYKSTFELSSFHQTPFKDQIDQDGDLFHLLAEGNNLNEETKLSFIEIPMFAKLRFILYDSKIFNHIFFNLGPVFSIGVSNSVIVDGTYTYRGYYPEYHVVLYDIPEYGYYTDTNINSTAESKTKSFNMSGLIEAGINIPLMGEALNMNLSVLYQKGFLNISETNDDYLLTEGYDKNNSILGSRSKVSTGLFGLNIGVLYKIF